ncbi:MAG TPA: hypothetical protein V6D00_06800 [Pantanalinema sp.]
MYILILRLLVHAGIVGHPGTICLQKMIELPFVPYVGLKLMEGTYHTELKDLAWAIDRRAFVSNIDLRQQLELLGLKREDLKQETVEELLEQLRGLGWERE